MKCAAVGTPPDRLALCRHLNRDWRCIMGSAHRTCDGEGPTPLQPEVDGVSMMTEGDTNN